MNPATKISVTRRLARIGGQVRGLDQMIRQERYCLDVVAQVRAARSALARIETQIAIGSLITRFPGIRLAEPSAEPAYKYVPGFRGLAELSVVLD